MNLLPLLTIAGSSAAYDQSVAAQAAQTNLTLWGMFLVGLLLLLLLLCLWLLWRVHTLSRAMRALQTDAEAAPLPGAWGFLPRFKMRTLLVMFTIAAVLLGMFASEFSRARRQGLVVAAITASSDVDLYSGAYLSPGVAWR